MNTLILNYNDLSFNSIVFDTISKNECFIRSCFPSPDGAVCGVLPLNGEITESRLISHLTPIMLNRNTLIKLGFTESKNRNNLFVIDEHASVLISDSNNNGWFIYKNNTFKVATLHELQALYTFHTKKQLICSL